MAGAAQAVTVIQVRATGKRRTVVQRARRRPVLAARLADLEHTFLGYGGAAVNRKART